MAFRGCPPPRRARAAPARRECVGRLPLDDALERAGDQVQAVQRRTRDGGRGDLRELGGEERPRDERDVRRGDDLDLELLGERRRPRPPARSSALCRTAIAAGESPANFRQRARPSAARPRSRAGRRPAASPRGSCSSRPGRAGLALRARQLAVDRRAVGRRLRQRAPQVRGGGERVAERERAARGRAERLDRPFVPAGAVSASCDATSSGAAPRACRRRAARPWPSLRARTGRSL